MTDPESSEHAQNLIDGTESQRHQTLTCPRGSRVALWGVIALATTLLIAAVFFVWPRTRSFEFVEVASLPPHSEPWTNAAMSSDGRLLALSEFLHLRCDPASVVVWDISGKPQQVCSFDGPNTICNALCFSPDGSLLVMGGNSGYVKIGSVAEGQIVRRIELTGSPPSAELGIDLRSVRCMQFSPDGRVLAIGTGRREVEIWSTETWTRHRTLSRHGFHVNDLAFSPDGGALMTAGEKRIEKEQKLLRASEVFVFETSGWEKIKECRFDLLPIYVTKLAWIGESFVAVGDQFGDLLLVNKDSMEPVAELVGHRNMMQGLAFDERRNSLISCSAEATIVWDLETFDLAGTDSGAGFIAYGQENGILATARSQDERATRLLRLDLGR